MCSGGYCLLILTNVIFYILVKKTNIEYNMEEKLISASCTMKDFKFEEHMSKIINNANSKLGIIKNTFHELTKDNFIIL